MEKLITSAQFRLNLGISQSTLSRGLKCNAYPYACHIKLGRRIFFPESLISKMAEAALNKAEKPSEALSD